MQFSYVFILYLRLVKTCKKWQKIFVFDAQLAERKVFFFTWGGGAHWALEHWYVTLRPKWVISEPNGPKIIQFDTKSDHSSSKNVSKIYVLYLRDFL